MLGDWQETSFKKFRDYPTKAAQTLVPYTYDLHRLPEGVSQEQRWMAEGRAAFEWATWALPAAKLAQGFRGASRAARAFTPMELTSTEYCFSGKVGLPSPPKNTGRSKNWLKPDMSAEGAHSVIRRDAATGEILNYATYRPQTNLHNPNPWELVKRYDSQLNPHRHYNKYLKQYIDTPHVHDSAFPGEVRIPFPWEEPNY